MAYVEKAKWPSGDETAHEYRTLDDALKELEQNKNNVIVSSELFDENDELIATYKKVEGVKMVEQIEEVEVSEATYAFMKNSALSFFDMYSEWKETEDEALNNALDELNTLSYTKGATDYFEGLIKGEMKLVKKVKKYRVILSGLHRFEGVQTYSEYVYLKSDGTLAKTKSFDYITVMSEKNMKKLPEWAQALAEEVK